MQTDVYIFFRHKYTAGSFCVVTRKAIWFPKCELNRSLHHCRIPGSSQQSNDTPSTVSVCWLIWHGEQQFLGTHRTEVAVIGAGDSPDVRWTRTGKHWTFEVENILNYLFCLSVLALLCVYQFHLQWIVVRPRFYTSTLNLCVFLKCFQFHSYSTLTITMPSWIVSVYTEKKVTIH